MWSKWNHMKYVGHCVLKYPIRCNEEHLSIHITKSKRVLSQFRILGTMKISQTKDFFRKFTSSRFLYDPLRLKQSSGIIKVVWDATEIQYLCVTKLNICIHFCFTLFSRLTQYVCVVLSGLPYNYWRIENTNKTTWEFVADEIKKLAVIYWLSYLLFYLYVAFSKNYILYDYFVITI